MEHRLNADEIACVKKLAERFEKNETWIQCGGTAGQPDSFVDPLELPAGKRDVILRLMEQMGAILDVTHTSEGNFHFFQISPSVLQLARAITEQEAKKEEPRDIVEQVKTTIKSNRITAWAIIAFLGFTALVTLVNQLLQLLKTLGVVRIP